ncbi:serine carboxypeptidase S28-domain-containing protein [Phialemonium atrogriseum]|uniref:Serine carboxypeptidase S28-domain-containing protein n=1 Tax=Phialemonium atrogriseum TaxID=1093897 RepID=A0AAJ0FL15_9PEZI|nr:serine carboxypeptidase S28-domain-containing protein [Phialemonium atrogriseum]KAK1771687.1 serine carboxypeptidase S28-domain-containing protein [Phialemonium atrogriseum]
MKASLLAVAAGLLAQAVPSVSQLLGGGALHGRPRGIKQQTHSDPDLVKNGTFDQLLDHNDPGKGTFKQRYWWDASEWGGPGSPIFLMNPGETAADGYKGYLEDGTITGRYAKEFGGAVILIEHRYWGKSIPFAELTAETLQYLDLPQSIFDMTYFATHVPLEFDDSNGGANAPASPWILVGGSYSGALAAWTSIIDPGVFWAYHASSAVVQAIGDFHAYFDAVERAIPRNCSADVRAVVAHVDAVLAAAADDDDDDAAILELKDMFGLGHLDHHDDFAAGVADPMGAWQNDPDAVFEFCDEIETSGGSTTSAAGVGLELALPAYAAYINRTVAARCSQTGECDTYSDAIDWDQPTYLDGDRQWQWMLCHNPFGWWQVGPPAPGADGQQQHVVSSFLRPDHYERTCPLQFPETNGFVPGITRGFTPAHLNLYTGGGWDADFRRVLFVNGEFDPWIEATVSARRRPGGPRNSTGDGDAPVLVIRNGMHAPELVINDVPEELSVLPDQIAVMERWLGEWVAPSSSSS